MGQKTCFAPACAIRYALSDQKFMERVAKRASAAQNKKMRQWKREERERLLTRSDWLKRAQRSFNAYIRGRDAGQPCISCQKSTGCKINAGHYRTTKAAPELRFNEDNCHLQCEKCNTYLSGNIGEYRIHLIKKIGLERVEALEGPHEPLKLTIDQIKSIEQTYKAKLKALQTD